MLEPDTTLVVEKTGGFAGVRQSFSVIASELSKEEQNQLSVLVDRCGLKAAQNTDLKSKGARDMFAYTFTLKANDFTCSASFDDKTLPADYKELLQLIQSLSRTR